MGASRAEGLPGLRKLKGRARGFISTNIAIVGIVVALLKSVSLEE